MLKRVVRFKTEVSPSDVTFKQPDCLHWNDAQQKRVEDKTVVKTETIQLTPQTAKTVAETLNTLDRLSLF